MNLFYFDWVRCSFPLARLVQSRSYSEYDNFQARKPDMMTVSQKDLSNSKKKVKTIEITEPEQVSLVSGIPEEHIKGFYYFFSFKINVSMLFYYNLYSLT